MPQFMDVHRGMTGITPELLKQAHQADLDIQDTEGMNFKQAWADPSTGVVCAEQIDLNTWITMSIQRAVDNVQAIGSARREIDEFAPDFIVIWGDDQYENFKEDLVPPFAVLAYEDQDIQPWAHRRSPERKPDLGIVAEVTSDVIRPARERQIRSYPWGTPQVALQLLDAKAHIPAETRFFAVLVTDCGPDPGSGLNLGVLEDAHALALVAPVTVDGLLSTHQTLARLRRTSATPVAASCGLIMGRPEQRDPRQVKGSSWLP